MLNFSSIRNPDDLFVRVDKPLQKYLKLDTKVLNRYKNTLNSNLKNIKNKIDFNNKVEEIEHYIPKREREINLVIDFVAILGFEVLGL